MTAQKVASSTLVSLVLLAPSVLAQAPLGHTFEVVSFNAAGTLALVAHCTVSGSDGVVSVLQTRSKREVARVALNGRHDLCNLHPTDSQLEVLDTTQPVVHQLVKKYGLDVRPTRPESNVPPRSSEPFPLNQPAQVLITAHDREFRASLFVGAKQMRTKTWRPKKTLVTSQAGYLEVAWHPNGKLVAIHGNKVTADSMKATMHSPVLMFWRVKPSGKPVPPATLAPQAARVAEYSLKRCEQRKAAGDDFYFYACQRAAKAFAALATLDPTRSREAVRNAKRAAEL